MKKLLLACGIIMLFTQGAFAQNLLVNGDFEAFNVPVYGDNLDVNISPWQYPDLMSSGPNTPYHRVSVMKLNPTQGFVFANNSNLPGFIQPQSDASQIMGQDRHAMRIYRDFATNSYSETRRLHQFFTAPYSGCVRYEAAFRNRGGQGSLIGRVQLHHATNNTVNTFNPNGGWASTPGLQRISFATWPSTINADGWGVTSNYVPIVAGQRYAYSIMSGSNFVDNAKVQYVDNINCPSIPAGTPNAPDLDVVKTCDPVTAVVSGPMTLNCSITVTGSNLPAGSYATILDEFSAMPPQTGANVVGQMMNITSNENWSCIDANTNLGLCELSSSDLFQAGGTSTVNITFQFESTTGTTQAVNCPFNQISTTSVIGSQNGGDQSALNSLVNNSVIGLPYDGCAEIDIPPFIIDDKPKESVELKKSCEVPVVGNYNGVQGFVWNCKIDVAATPVAPFNGTFILVEDASQISGTTGGIFTSYSPTNPWQCSGLNTPLLTCPMNGSNFTSANGFETVNVQLFAPQTSDTDPIEWKNCASGILVTQDAQTEIEGNCQNTYIKPVTIINPVQKVDVKKTCEPIESVTALEPYTLDCAITVTGSNLPAGSIVSVVDGFGAFPTGTATIQGPMTNITSNEPWTCIDANTNIGLCELPGADLMAAGGSSTINMTFDFTASDDAVSVVNCPFIDITDESYINQQIKPKSAMQNPLNSQNKSVAGLPDGCVVIELPTDEPPHITLKKSCDVPVAGFSPFTNAPGYLWNCKIDIDAVPSPYNGTIIIDEDASNVFNGLAQFISASHPSCIGFSTPNLSCAIDGNSLAPNPTTPSGSLDVSLFLTPDSPKESIKWENCVKGYGKGEKESIDAKGNCVSVVIEPPKEPPVAKEIKINKHCDRPSVGEYGNRTGVAWKCYVDIQASPAPFAGSFTFTEDATAVTGSGFANITNINSSNAWSCNPQPVTNITDCTIAGSNFNPSGETLTFDLFAEIGDQSLNWRNCVSGNYSAPNSNPIKVEGNCVPLVWNIVTPPVVTKDCVETRKGGYYQCTITVEHEPFIGTMWIDDMLSVGYGGAGFGNQLIGQVASNDNWNCSSAAYTQSTPPMCSIDGVNFPASGSSTLTYQLGFLPPSILAKGEVDNCVTVNIGKPGSGDSEQVAETCYPFTVVSKEPKLEVEKTCEAATLNSATGEWTVNCTINVTGENLPTNGRIRVTDEMVNSSTHSATSAYIQHINGPSGNCGGSTLPNGLMSACDFYSDDIINAAGGAVGFGFTGGFEGHGIRTRPAQNCAIVENDFGLPSVTSCVNIPFTPLVIDGGTLGTVPVIFTNPAGGGDDGGSGGENGGGIDVGTPISHTGSAQPVDLPNGGDSGGTVVVKPSEEVAHAAISIPKLALSQELLGKCRANDNNQLCDFRVKVTNVGTAPLNGVIGLSDHFSAPLSLVDVDSSAGWNCARSVGNSINCVLRATNLLPGNSIGFDMALGIKGPRNGGEFKTCATAPGQDRKQKIAILQYGLTLFGEKLGAIDGIWGANTKRALFNVQSKLGLAQQEDFTETLQALGLSGSGIGAPACVQVTLPPMTQKATPVVKPKPTPKPKPIVRPKPKPVITTEPVQDVKPVLEIKPRPKPRPIVKPAPVVVKPVVKPRPKPKPKPVVKPAPVVVKPVVKPRPKPKPKPVVKPAPVVVKPVVKPRPVVTKPVTNKPQLAACKKGYIFNGKLCVTLKEFKAAAERKLGGSKKVGKGVIKKTLN